ncbi:MAG: ABC transporter ATP-binding protein [Alphaproteobacteria bacterium]|nr:ABC transporter ATP-binding protein [Alphaproteobacteria bacterium]MCW5742945.1 ABC transporter ATP-binding protein [Alphaproteobacteria bacterium]
MALIAAALGHQLGAHMILQGIELTLEPGRLCVVIGPNGAGKSTLLRMLAGIERPDSGAVSLTGTMLESMAPRERARRIAHLPQATAAHWPLSGRDMVALGRLPHGAGLETPRAADAAAITKAMARTDTASFADRRIDMLSSGERARLALARILATEAEVLLADEPVASLDPAQQLAAMDALREEAGRGAIVVVVLHDLALVSRYADRVVVLANGRVVGDGPPGSALAPDTLERVYGARFEMASIPVAISDRSPAE